MDVLMLPCEECGCEHSGVRQLACKGCGDTIACEELLRGHCGGCIRTQSESDAARNDYWVEQYKLASKWFSEHVTPRVDAYWASR